MIVSTLDPRTIQFSFAKPAPYLNMNDRLHWTRRAERSALWLQAAHVAAVQTRNTSLRLAGWALPIELAEVRVEFKVADPYRRRDPHNWFPTVKPIVDGLVTAGYFVDDDSTHVRTVEPGFVKGSNWVRVSITELVP